MKSIAATLVTGTLVLGAGTTSAVAVHGSQPKMVKVTLKEMRVIPAAKQVSAGKITFVGKNAGSVVHELVIVKANGRTNLPVKNYKAQEGKGVIGEIEDVEPGTTKRVTLTLKRGKYLLICNVTGHYQLGMRAILNVS